jgi:predicted PurR-regulated permease PerM
VILVGLLGGIAVFGALGLVLGPILLATALALLSAYVEAPPHDIWRA